MAFINCGEKLLAKQNGITINNVDKVRVYNRGIRAIGIPATSNDVASIRGHIYIGQGASLSFSEDYSTHSTEDKSIIVHELVHVYQVRTLKWSRIKYIRKWLAAADDYCYITIDKKYDKYNMEEQAQMVQDRYLLDNSRPHWLLCNSGVTLEQLNDVILF